jgi:hypothetical protein
MDIQLNYPEVVGSRQLGMTFDAVPTTAANDRAFQHHP